MRNCINCSLTGCCKKRPKVSESGNSFLIYPFRCRMNYIHLHIHAAGGDRARPSEQSHKVRHGENDRRRSNLRRDVVVIISSSSWSWRRRLNNERRRADCSVSRSLCQARVPKSEQCLFKNLYIMHSKWFTAYETKEEKKSPNNLQVKTTRPTTATTTTTMTLIANDGTLLKKNSFFQLLHFGPAGHQPPVDRGKHPSNGN